MPKDQAGGGTPVAPVILILPDGSIPAAGQLTDADQAILQRSVVAYENVGESLSRSKFKAAITETMRTLADANKYLSDQAPWKLRESDPERMRTICHRVASMSI